MSAGDPTRGAAAVLEPLEPRLLLDAADVVAAALADGGDPWYWPPSASVSPDQPDTGNPVSITLAGEWPDGGIPGELAGHPSIERLGSNIFVSAYVYFGSVLPVITPWSMTEMLGPLPAGDYRVFASLYYWTTPDDVWLAEGPDPVAEFSVVAVKPGPPGNVRVAPRDDTGASDSDGITKHPKPEIVWGPSPDPEVVGYEVSVSFHEGPFWVSGTSWVWPYRSNLPEGTHTVYVRAKNQAGGFSDPAVGRFTVDYDGPHIVLHSPAGIVPEPSNEVYVTFNEPTNEGTFTTDDVTVTADALFLYIPVTGVCPVGKDTYRITFDGPGLPVDYHVVIGPDIEDLAGNAMNQDRDAVNGERPDDMYDAGFVVPDVPQVVDMWPAPGSAHWLVSSVRARFSREMDSGTVGLKNVWVSQDRGPDGQFGTPDDVRVEGFVDYDPLTLTAVFTPYLERLPCGVYALCITDDVTDVRGIRLDGEWPGLWPGFPSGDGEPGGVFAAEFVVDTVSPVISAVQLNGRPGRGAGDIEPSGVGVRTIDVTFSEAVCFDPAAVGVKAVEFSTGMEQERLGVLPAVAVTGSGTNVMTITLGDPAGTVGAVDTWVKVTLAAAGITDAAANALDGEPRSNSSGLGYIYDAVEDLPSGNGAPGGDAVFYVGSLRCDMQGPTFSDMTPDGRITPWDINGFTIKYLAGDMDVDVWGPTFSNSTPDGAITPWDINGFIILYREAVAAGRHLDPLPVAGPLAAGSPTPAALLGVLADPEVDPLPVAGPLVVGSLTPAALLGVLADPEVDLLRRGWAAQSFAEVAQASLEPSDLDLDALTATAISTATPTVLLEAAADRADTGAPVAPADARNAAAPDEGPALGEDLVDLLSLPALAAL